MLISRLGFVLQGAPPFRRPGAETEHDWIVALGSEWRITPSG